MAIGGSPGHSGRTEHSAACPQLPPAPPVPSVVALTLPPNPAFPQPESQNLRTSEAAVSWANTWNSRDLGLRSANFAFKMYAGHFTGR